MECFYVGIELILCMPRVDTLLRISVCCLRNVLLVAHDADCVLLLVSSPSFMPGLVRGPDADSGRCSELF